MINYAPTERLRDRLIARATPLDQIDGPLRQCRNSAHFCVKNSAVCAPLLYFVTRY